MREQGVFPSEHSEPSNETPAPRAGYNRLFSHVGAARLALVGLLAFQSATKAEEPAETKTSSRAYSLTPTPQPEHIVPEEIPPPEPERIVAEEIAAPPPLKKKPPSAVRVMGVTMHLQKLRLTDPERAEEIRQAILAKRSMEKDPVATKQVQKDFEKRTGNKTTPMMRSVLGSAVTKARYKKRLEKTVAEYNAMNPNGLQITFDELDAAIGMLVKIEDKERIRAQEMEETIALDDQIPAITKNPTLVQPVSNLEEASREE